MSEVSEVLEYDIVSDRDALRAKLAGSSEIDALTSKLDVYDMNSIVTFGNDAAAEVSKAADQILRGMTVSQLDESGQLMQALAKVMSRFDPDALEAKPGFLGRLLGGAQKKLDEVLDRYHTLGDEVDKIYIGLRQCEAEITRSNQQLEKMFEANVGYFHELEKYIAAGEQGCIEIRDYMEELNEKKAQTGDKSIDFELQTLGNALTMLERRTHDLKLAEAVAMQSIPMIRTIQFSNTELVRKINSAFIVTLPVFKQALAQAILLKRQQLQREALSALEARTGEMLKRNAVNTAEQIRLSAGDDGLKNAWRTIVSGIDETKQMGDAARAQRQRDQEKLERIQKEFNEKKQNALST